MKPIAINFTVCSLMLLFAYSAQAQLGYQDFRHIHINGVHVDDAQILNLDATLGYEVPNGFYWVNDNTGEWGYEGNGEVLGSIYTEATQRNNTEVQSTQSSQQTSSPKQSGNSRPYISNDTGTGSAVIDSNGCSYVSAGGMTVKSCD